MWAKISNSQNLAKKFNRVFLDWILWVVFPPNNKDSVENVDRVAFSCSRHKAGRPAHVRQTPASHLVCTQRPFAKCFSFPSLKSTQSVLLSFTTLFSQGKIHEKGLHSLPTDRERVEESQAGEKEREEQA